VVYENRKKNGDENQKVKQNAAVHNLKKIKNKGF
jgi:hypothetical protein